MELVNLDSPRGTNANITLDKLLKLDREQKAARQEWNIQDVEDEYREPFLLNDRAWTQPDPTLLANPEFILMRQDLYENVNGEDCCLLFVKSLYDCARLFICR